MMMEMQPLIELSSAPLDASKAWEAILAREAGGTCIFVGTVRSATRGKEVVALEFEVYEDMALKEMHKIAESAMTRWEVLRVGIWHRTGRLEVGEVPVIIAVAAAHRGDAFSACQFCIDTLKETVPIWKKEIFQDGEIWVAAHP